MICLDLQLIYHHHKYSDEELALYDGRLEDAPKKRVDYFGDVIAEVEPEIKLVKANWRIISGMILALIEVEVPQENLRRFVFVSNTSKLISLQKINQSTSANNST